MVFDTARIRNKELRKKIVSADEAVRIIESGMSVGTAVREAGALSAALVKRARQLKNFNITLWSATVGLEMDSTLGEAGIIKNRLGQQTQLRNAINAGEVAYNDTSMSKYCRAIRNHEYGLIDVAIAEAVAITEEGNIIPACNLVEMASLVAEADKIIVKLNPFYPLQMEGMHDIYLRKGSASKEPIPLTELGSRIGTPHIPLGRDKTVYIVVSDAPDIRPPKATPNDMSKRIASNLVSFLKKQLSLGRLPLNLLPIEIGLVGIPDMVLAELCRSEFSNLAFYSSILSDGVIDLIDLGKVEAASCTSLILSDGVQKRFLKDVEKYKRYIILRPIELLTSPELLSRFGVIAINSVVEVDIYGHGNATHTGGTRVVNGIGGLGEFAENAELSILVLPSVTKDGDISTIVPMVPHVDINEHHVDIIVTEHGLADVRGLPPVERAEKIIRNCAHPDYKPLLQDYLNRAIKQNVGHEPHILEEALSFHQRLSKTGTMKKSGS